jgi:hypothetical protein
MVQFSMVANRLHLDAINRLKAPAIAGGVGFCLTKLRAEHVLERWYQGFFCDVICAVTVVC